MTLGLPGNVASGSFTTVIGPTCTESMMQTGIVFAPLDAVRVAAVGPHAPSGKLRRRFMLRAGYF